MKYKKENGINKMVTRNQRIKEFEKYIDTEYGKTIKEAQNEVLKCCYPSVHLSGQDYYVAISKLNFITKYKKEFYHGYYRKYMAAYKIQQFVKQILYNPHHRVGKAFIYKKYDKLNAEIKSK